MAIPTTGKIVLIFCMLLGRLEFYTMLALFFPSFWKK
jgi:trk system potassium uptake protein TrkH